MKHIMKFIKPYIVEIGIRNRDLDYVIKQGVIIFALAVAAFVCALVTNRVSSNFSSKIAVNMRRQVFNKVNELTFEQFSEIGTGSLLTRTTDDIGWMEETISQVPYVLISCPILFIGGIALCWCW